MIHPIFEQFRWSAPVADADWSVNPLGVRTRRRYDSDVPPLPTTQAPTSENPFPLNEEVLEWIVLLEAVAEAQTNFVMIELGAGYGRVLANAAAAARQRESLACTLIGVEAEPDHFAFLRRHLLDNGIDPKDCTLIEAAVNQDGASVPFVVGAATSHYGQSIYRDDMRIVSRLKRLVKGTRKTVRHVPGVTLASLLEPFPYVDFVHMDIQGEEGVVVSSSIALMTERARRVHIGTHSADVEGQVRAAFLAHGWQCLNDYGCLTTAETPYGTVTFQDGVQSWINPAVPRAAGSAGGPTDKTP